MARMCVTQEFGGKGKTIHFQFLISEDRFDWITLLINLNEMVPPRRRGW